MRGKFEITWVDGKRGPRDPPHPDFPTGKDLDTSGDAKQSCLIELPYPAARCGWYTIKCVVCGLDVMVSTAGRLDDLRLLKVACAPNKDGERE